MQVNFLARFYSYVKKSGGCWNWIGGKKQTGYGNFRFGAKIVVAHRWHWEQLNGSIPIGMTLHHLCYNRGCVRLDHLQLMSQSENSKLKRGRICPKCAYHFF